MLLFLHMNRHSPNFEKFLPHQEAKKEPLSQDLENRQIFHDAFELLSKEQQKKLLQYINEHQLREPKQMLRAMEELTVGTSEKEHHAYAVDLVNQLALLMNVPLTTEIRQNIVDRIEAADIMQLPIDDRRKAAAQILKEYTSDATEFKKAA